jgi:hypothetical protein
MDTNFDQSSPEDSQTFKAWSPRAPRSLQPQARPSATMLPPPRPQTTISAERERELLDRRRNWVFMTPEDYASPDGKNNDDNDSKKGLTAMERFYQRLYDSDSVALTNKFNKPDSDRLGGRTNLLGRGELPNVDGGAFKDSPFNSDSDPSIFQSVRRSSFSNPFGSDGNTPLLTPEQVRLQAEQKAHMESYKQIWNIDQPATASVSSPGSAPVDSGPLFGLSAPGVQTIHSDASSGTSVSQSQTPTSRAEPTRYPRPPHADFAPTQRPF